MNEFYPVVVLLLLLASGFVLFPILLKRGSLQTQRRGANIALFNQRQGELNNELSRGVIDADQFTEMVTYQIRHRLRRFMQIENFHTGVGIFTVERCFPDQSFANMNPCAE